MRSREVAIILAAATLWLPGLMGASLLSDTLISVMELGTAPVGPWFYTEYGGYYRPLAALVFRIGYLLWGMSPFGYYLSAWLLHTGCALALWHLAGFLYPTHQRSGLWAALVFLFLPNQVFGVLVALNGTLCTLLYTGAVALYLRGRSGNPAYRLLSLLAFALALMAKELAVTLPFLLLAWEGALSGFQIRRWLRGCGPYFLLLAGYGVFRYLWFGHLPTSPLHTNLDPLRLLVNAGIYSAKIFAPWGLEGLKPFFRAHPLGLWVAALGGMGLAGVLTWCAWGRVQRVHLLGALWVGVTMLPVLRLYSPWSGYLPAVGAVLLLVGLVNGLENRKVRLGALSVWLCLSVAYLIQQQYHWRQAGILCQKVVDEVIRRAEERPGRIYLANLPAELGEAPLFSGDWGLMGALQLRGKTVDIATLANVYKTAVEENTRAVVVDDRRFELRLETPGEFFRVETFEVLSKQVRAEIGYTYGKGDARVTVRGIGSLGEPNLLEIDMGSPEKLQQVMVWDGSRLVPLVR